ncbi:12695_t:CDS:2, partial [Entrophospora sp. SA101]
LPEPTLENLATIHSIIKIASESSELEKYQLASFLLEKDINNDCIDENMGEIPMQM